MDQTYICDTHAHYDDEAFDSDRDSLLKTGLAQGGVEFVVNMGASMAGADASAELSEKYDIIYAGCGIHPDDVGVFEHAGAGCLTDPAQSSGQPDDAPSFDAEICMADVAHESGGLPSAAAVCRTDEDESEETARRRKEWARFSDPEEAMQHLYELCCPPKTVCVGEIGLDYHWMVETKEVQMRWFREQMHLAYELKLPINVHSRNAAQDTFDLIKENYQNGYFSGGIIHCFSGSRELAREYVKMGYHLGIGGVVTFKNSKTLKKVVEDTPIEYLVTETDAPYMAPEPNRGRRNDSRNIRYVIEKVAEIKQMDVEDCARALRRNAHAVYRV